MVSTAWLAEHLDAPDVKVADATWFLPTLRRDAGQEYAAGHIPGAVFFDIDDVADAASPLPHMLPDGVKFSSRMRRLGLGDGTRIVLYDNNKYSASARAWWMLRLFGHPEVAVLDGGLAKWRAEGRPVTDAPVTPKAAHFTARQNNLLLRDLAQMRANVLSRREQVVDARSAGRFAGTEPEPRAGLRGGHIPGSVCLPHLELIATDGTLLPAPELRRRFAAAGVDLSQPVVTSCGSGVTASTLALALYRLGRDDVAVYDGSWSEWGGRSDTPIET
jgi:thiosulfate/3-mercaptopyruvate sulfurtransferase